MVPYLSEHYVEFRSLFHMLALASAKFFDSVNRECFLSALRRSGVLKRYYHMMAPRIKSYHLECGKTSQEIVNYVVRALNTIKVFMTDTYQ